MPDNTLITPPRKLVAQWIGEGSRQEYCTTDEYLIDKVVRWGYKRRGAVNEAELQKARDEELEACCALLDERLHDGTSLRAARRPKPKSQAEKALASLDGVPLPEEAWQAVSAALERLRELEESSEND